MNRVKIQLPEKFNFSTEIPIRITDLNYGGHVGNDTVLTLIHEARMQFLGHHGYTEMNFEGVGMIMNEASIEFKTELFYGDVVHAFITANDFSRVGFTIYYKLLKLSDNSLVAIAKTGMICYNYEHKKVVSVPENARMKLMHDKE